MARHFFDTPNGMMRLDEVCRNAEHLSPGMACDRGSPNGVHHDVLVRDKTCQFAFVAALTVGGWSLVS